MCSLEAAGAPFDVVSKERQEERRHVARVAEANHLQDDNGDS